MQNSMLRGTFGCVALATLSIFLACGAESGASDGVSADGGGGAGGGQPFGTGDDGPSCRTTSECADGLVCHPFVQSCVTPGVTCSSHDECGSPTYCDSVSGTCLAGGVGNPCATDDNCVGGTCVSGTCGCTGIAQQQESYAALDIYFIFDRTASMGEDCDYQPGTTPPVQSKACFATYALSEYLINLQPSAPTRLAFQFMSLSDNDCDGAPYATPLADLTALPLVANDPIVQAISAEAFQGGIGTHIEGALNGIAAYTASHRTPGREIIGVLMTDGDPNGCDENIGNLRRIIADHYAATGIRTFIIGMEGATDANLEEYASAGGAEAHADWCGSMNGSCHFWNVGDGSGDAVESALRAILGQATPLPCNYAVANLTPPEGHSIDFKKVNVRLAQQSGDTIIGQVPNAASCPADQAAWYYDEPVAPTEIQLCPNACALVTDAQSGSTVTVVLGCGDTVTVR